MFLIFISGRIQKHDTTSIFYRKIEVIASLSTLRKLQDAISSQRQKFSDFSYFRQEITNIEDFFDEKLKNLKILSLFLEFLDVKH